MRKSEKVKVDLSKLTPAEARVHIAKDVLAQIKAKYFTVVRGQYVVLDNPLTDEELDKPLGELAKKNQCSVCALGAMFMTSVKKDKDYLGRQIVDVDYEEDTVEIERTTLTSRLSSYFSANQMNLIENCFEGRIIHGSHLAESTANKYMNKYSDADKSLTAICENIIRNQGEFIPEQDIISK